MQNRRLRDNKNTESGDEHKNSTLVPLTHIDAPLAQVEAGCQAKGSHSVIPRCNITEMIIITDTCDLNAHLKWTFQSETNNPCAALRNAQVTRRRGGAEKGENDRGMWRFPGSTDECQREQDALTREEEGGVIGSLTSVAST